MSDKQLHDDLENLALQLRQVIPVLQTLAERTADSINNQIDNSLIKVDTKVADLSNSIRELNRAVSSNKSIIMTAEEEALMYLRQGVQLLIDRQVAGEYKEQIQAIVNDIQPLITDSVNTQIKRIADSEILSIEHHNEQIKDINSTVKTDMQTAVTNVNNSIVKLEELEQKINKRADEKIGELDAISTAHTNELGRIEDATGTSVLRMKSTLANVERHAVFMAQSPVSLIAVTAGFFNISLLMALVYTYSLFKAFFVSMLILAVVLGGIWGLVYWIGTQQEDE